jgi:hypothetical protein
MALSPQCIFLAKQSTCEQRVQLSCRETAGQCGAAIADLIGQTGIVFPNRPVTSYALGVPSSCRWPGGASWI